MSTPRKDKGIAIDVEVRSPKNFKWLQPMEDTLLELLLAEVQKGNRPGGTFSSTAYHNVVANINDIHGTQIAKQHVLSRIKTMKTNFVLFHGAFSGLSGFAWNHENNQFEAEDDVWAIRIKDNPKLARLRGKSIHNWDKLHILWSNSRATGDATMSFQEEYNRRRHAINFEDPRLRVDACIDSNEAQGNCSSRQFTQASQLHGTETTLTVNTDSRNTGGSSRSLHKRKASVFLPVEVGCNELADSIRDLSTTFKDYKDTKAMSRPGPTRNKKILSLLKELGLQKQVLVKCYRFLTQNPKEAASFIGAEEFRRDILEAIIRDNGLD